MAWPTRPRGCCHAAGDVRRSRLGVAVGENEENRSQKSEVRSQNEELGSSPLPAGGDQSKIQNPKSKIGGSDARVTIVAFEPNIYLYDKSLEDWAQRTAVPHSDSLLEKTQRLIANCPCASGCPSCVGPIGEVGEKGKEVALGDLAEVVRCQWSVVRGPLLSCPWSFDFLNLGN